MPPSTPEPDPPPRGRWVAYLLVALAAFLAGMAFGQWGRPPPGARSRVGWPEAAARP